MKCANDCAIAFCGLTTVLSSLILKRASASRSSGQWSDDDYDVLENGVVVGRICKEQTAPPDRPSGGQRGFVVGDLTSIPTTLPR